MIILDPNEEDSDGATALHFASRYKARASNPASEAKLKQVR